MFAPLRHDIEHSEKQKATGSWDTHELVETNTIFEKLVGPKSDASFWTRMAKGLLDKATTYDEFGSVLPLAELPETDEKLDISEIVGEIEMKMSQNPALHGYEELYNIVEDMFISEKQVAHISDTENLEQSINLDMQKTFCAMQFAERQKMETKKSRTNFLGKVVTVAQIGIMFSMVAYKVVLSVRPEAAMDAKMTPEERADAANKEEDDVNDMAQLAQMVLLAGQAGVAVYAGHRNTVKNLAGRMTGFMVLRSVLGGSPLGLVVGQVSVDAVVNRLWRIEAEFQNEEDMKYANWLSSFGSAAARKGDKLYEKIEDVLGFKLPRFKSHFDEFMRSQTALRWILNNFASVLGVGAVFYLGVGNPFAYISGQRILDMYFGGKFPYELMLSVPISVLNMIVIIPIIRGITTFAATQGIRVSTQLLHVGSVMMYNKIARQKMRDPRYYYMSNTQRRGLSAKKKREIAKTNPDIIFRALQADFLGKILRRFTEVEGTVMNLQMFLESVTGEIAARHVIENYAPDTPAIANFMRNSAKGIASVLSATSLNFIPDAELLVKANHPSAKESDIHRYFRKTLEETIGDTKKLCERNEDISQVIAPWGCAINIARSLETIKNQPTMEQRLNAQYNLALYVTFLSRSLNPAAHQSGPLSEESLNSSHMIRTVFGSENLAVPDVVREWAGAMAWVGPRGLFAHSLASFPPEVEQALTDFSESMTRVLRTPQNKMRFGNAMREMTGQVQKLKEAQEKVTEAFNTYMDSQKDVFSSFDSVRDSFLSPENGGSDTSENNSSRNSRAEKQPKLEKPTMRGEDQRKAYEKLSKEDKELCDRLKALSEKHGGKFAQYLFAAGSFELKKAMWETMHETHAFVDQEFAIAAPTPFQYAPFIAKLENTTELKDILKNETEIPDVSEDVLNGLFSAFCATRRVEPQAQEGGGLLAPDDAENKFICNMPSYISLFRVMPSGREMQKKVFTKVASETMKKFISNNMKNIVGNVNAAAGFVTDHAPDAASQAVIGSAAVAIFVSAEFAEGLAIELAKSASKEFSKQVLINVLSMWVPGVNFVAAVNLADQMFTMGMNVYKFYDTVNEQFECATGKMISNLVPTSQQPSLPACARIETKSQQKNGVSIEYVTELIVDQVMGSANAPPEFKEKLGRAGLQHIHAGISLAQKLSDDFLKTGQIDPVSERNMIAELLVGQHLVSQLALYETWMTMDKTPAFDINNLMSDIFVAAGNSKDFGARANDILNKLLDMRDVKAGDFFQKIDKLFRTIDRDVVAELPSVMYGSGTPLSEMMKSVNAVSDILEIPRVTPAELFGSTFTKVFHATVTESDSGWVPFNMGHGRREYLRDINIPFDRPDFDKEMYNTVHTVLRQIQDKNGHIRLHDIYRIRKVLSTGERLFVSENEIYEPGGGFLSWAAEKGFGFITGSEATGLLDYGKSSKYMSQVSKDTVWSLAGYNSRWGLAESSGGAGILSNVAAAGSGEKPEMERRTELVGMPPWLRELDRDVHSIAKEADDVRDNISAVNSASDASKKRNHIETARASMLVLRKNIDRVLDNPMLTDEHWQQFSAMGVKFGSKTDLMKLRTDVERAAEMLQTMLTFPRIDSLFSDFEKLKNNLSGEIGNKIKQNIEKAGSKNIGIPEIVFHKTDVLIEKVVGGLTSVLQADEMYKDTLRTIAKTFDVVLDDSGSDVQEVSGIITEKEIDVLKGVVRSLKPLRQQIKDMKEADQNLELLLAREGDIFKQITQAVENKKMSMQVNFGNFFDGPVIRAIVDFYSAVSSHIEKFRIYLHEYEDSTEKYVESLYREYLNQWEFLLSFIAMPASSPSGGSS